jgi:transposase
MTPLKNPLPADFREHLHKTVPQQSAMYGVGRHTIARWRRLCGISVHQRAWTDADLDTLKTLVEAGHSYDAIAKRMGLGRKRVCNAVERYRLSKGAAQPRPTVRPVPDDFVDMWTQNPNSALAKHYAASTKTVQRWVREKGLVRTQRGGNVRAVDFTRQPVEKQQKIAKPGYMTAPIDRGYKEDSAAGEAQRVLQRDGWKPVVRCDAAGKVDQKGRFWICGRSVGISDAELIERAERAKVRLYGSKAA